MEILMPLVTIVSPEPTDNSQGVERFCHLLTDALTGAGMDASVVGVDDETIAEADLVITNAFTKVRGARRRLHVHHGCAIPQCLQSHAEATLRWRVKSAIGMAYREYRAARGAFRVSVSGQCAAEVKKWYGLSSAVIPNGVDTSVFRSRERSQARESVGVAQESRIALFVGRPEWRKRPDIALAAARAQGYELMMASSRDFSGARWQGSLPPADLATWIAAADVVLMPSQYEACSFALLECLAVGTPIVTTRVGWVPDLLRAVPSYAHLTSRPGDLAAFTDSLANLESSQTGAAEASDYVRTKRNLSVFNTQWSRLVAELLSTDRGRCSSSLTARR
jgi:glycosyltransferase involved in cell wall biosynthesis